MTIGGYIGEDQEKEKLLLLADPGDETQHAGPHGEAPGWAGGRRGFRPVFIGVSAGKEPCFPRPTVNTMESCMAGGADRRACSGCGRSPAEVLNSGGIGAGENKQM